MDLRDFFTAEAGQRRRAWLNRQDAAASEAVRYFLGPTGIPDKLTPAAELAAMLSPGADVQDAYTASGDLVAARSPLDAATAAAGLTGSLAGLFMPGSFSTAKQGFTDLVDEGVKAHKSGKVFMFAGPAARTADHAALARAQALQAQGAPRDQILKETGWFTGSDGKWRFEIDDSQAKYTGPDPRSAKFTKGIGGTGYRGGLEKGLEHPAVFEAYPQLRDVEFHTEDIPGETYGQFVGNAADPNYGAQIIVGKKAADPRSVMLHETQHAVQSIENFARGSTPDAPMTPGTPLWSLFQRNLDELDGAPLTLEQFAKANPKFTPEDAKHWYEVLILPSLGRSPQNVQFAEQRARQQAYTGAAGEVEARNVQTRRDMGPTQRAAQAPWTTQDTPDRDQFFEFRGGPASAANRPAPGRAGAVPR